MEKQNVEFAYIIVSLAQMFSASRNILEKMCINFKNCTKWGLNFFFFFSHMIIGSAE